MQIGDLVRVPLPEGRSGAAWVVGASATAVKLRFGAIIWDCEPGADEIGEGPWVVDLSVPRAQAQAAVVVGQQAVTPEPVEAVVDAPLAVLFATLVSLG